MHGKPKREADRLLGLGYADRALLTTLHSLKKLLEAMALDRFDIVVCFGLKILE